MAPSIRRLWKPLLTALALLALSALVWWIGPLVAVADWRPLEGVVARAVTIAVPWLAWLVVGGWRLLRRRRANAALVSGLAGGVSASDRESQVLEQRFRDAIRTLERGRKGALFGRRRALNELPWYVFVGAPGSGKTTALRNAGLQFLLADGAESLKGVGGTRNCDWWFTADAVLIDTAGRYTTQESDAEVDASAWDKFLSLLRRTRPRQPINGVLLTLNVQDLLQQGAGERRLHAQKLRARLHELQSKLGVTAPTYVLVTKVDLVAGFNESFDAFGKEQRDQVWGFTMPRPTRAPEAMASFDAEFTALEETLNKGLYERLAAERDPARRARMFEFPIEFANLRPVLREFLQVVFAGGGALEEDANLRGLYFTSATQEGTPIDRVMGALSRSFGLPPATGAAAARGGKSFFLHDLLRKVIFPEQHLVSFNARLERRRSALRAAGFAALATIAVGLGAGWALSWSRNEAHARQVEAKLPELRQTVEGLPPQASADVAHLAPVLTQVRTAAAPADFPVDDPPLLQGLGLYQGEKLDAAAQVAYRRLLEHALLPGITRRLEERVRGSGRDNLEQAYEALKAYLMLYTPDRFDAGFLKAWIAVDWDANYERRLTPEQRRELDGHLDALLAQGAPAPAGPMDKALVQSAREMLTAYPLAHRIYSRIRRQYRGDVPEFSLARAAGPAAQAVFMRASGEPLTRGVPGFFTRDGYEKAFQGSVQPAAARLMAEEGWVLGVRGETRVKDVLGSELPDAVRRLYLQDYVAHWDRFLADVRVVPVGDVTRGLEVARQLAGLDSPLAAFVRAVVRETTLIPPPQENPGGVAGKAAAQAAQAKADIARLAGAQPTAAGGSGPIERIVDDHYAPLRRLVQGTPAPIEDVNRAFAEIHLYLQSVDAAIRSKSPPPPAAAAQKLKAAAATLPEPVRGSMAALADAGVRGGREGERESFSAEMRPVFEFCSRAVANRYPFASGSRADVLPDDFGQLFGYGGLLDEFFQRRLAAVVDTAANPWSYKPLPDGSAAPGAAALADFQRAARIREAFFRAGGRMPAFRMDVRALELGEGVKELVLDVDGEAIRFSPDSPASAALQWPGRKIASRVTLSIPATTPVSFEGPWALFRLLDRFEVQPSGRPERLLLVIRHEGRRAKLEITSGSVLNPLRMRELQQFRCPGAL